MTDYKHKINAEGEYLPFYGYTSVSMLSSKTSSVLQNIEQLISQQLLVNIILHYLIQLII